MNPTFGFVGVVVPEGRADKASRSYRVTLPSRIAQAMREDGATFPGWLRLTVDGEAVFACARWVPSRPSSVDIVLPSWFGTFVQGQRVDVVAEAAEPYRARAMRATSRFDWLPFVPADLGFFATEVDSDLVIWSRYEAPFRLVRLADVVTTHRLFGW